MITRIITVIGFVIVIGAIGTLELVARRPTNKIPTIGEWLGYLMRGRAGRVLILLGWLWLGWHYFAR